MGHRGVGGQQGGEVGGAKTHPDLELCTEELVCCCLPALLSVSLPVAPDLFSSGLGARCSCSHGVTPIDQTLGVAAPPTQSKTISGCQDYRGKTSDVLHLANDHCSAFHN